MHGAGDETNNSSNNRIDYVGQCTTEIMIHCQCFATDNPIDALSMPSWYGIDFEMFGMYRCLYHLSEQLGIPFRKQKYLQRNKKYQKYLHCQNIDGMVWKFFSKTSSCKSFKFQTLSCTSFKINPWNFELHSSTTKKVRFFDFWTRWPQKFFHIVGREQL